MAKKLGRRKLSLDELKKIYRKCGGKYDGAGFVVDDHLDKLVWMFNNEGDYCDWCVIETIAHSQSPSLYNFWLETLSSERYYAVSEAIHWLLRHNTEEARNALWQILPSKLRHADTGIRRAAIEGLYGLDTKEARTLLWQARTTYVLGTLEETQKFRDMIDEVMKSSDRHK
ncbi:MAG: hypothetical protein DPW16_00335 [Chloroflexi bacterium]|nr:hypothetical protein [Chloroflexota bacterium]